MFMLQNILPDISMTEDSSQVFELCALKDFFKIFGPLSVMNLTLCRSEIGEMTFYSS